MPAPGHKTKVLIVSYYWPPSAGGGVHRWLKFSKYLAKLDIEPVIFTPDNPDFSLRDPSLLQKVSPDVRVVRRPIREPYQYYKALLPKTKRARVNQPSQITGYKKGLLNRLVMYIRSNMFIPDPRVWWVRPSVRFLEKYTRDTPVDCIITTGPPHSMHLIGLGIKRATGLPWIADFRDPWTQIDFFEELDLSKRALEKHMQLEKEVVKKADARVTVSPSVAKNFETLHKCPFQVITNGFDPEDYRGLQDRVPDGLLRILYVGSLNKSRNPKILWQVLGQMYALHPELPVRVKLLGSVDQSVFEDIRAAGLSDLVKHEEQVPHQEGLQEMKASDLLLLLINETPGNEGLLPGKMFEYMAVGKPILCIGNQKGDSAEVIRSGKLGYTVSSGDQKGLAEILESILAEDAAGIFPESANTSIFSVEELAKNYRDLILRTLGSAP